MLLYAAGLAWFPAFGGFALFFGPLLAGRPPMWSGRTQPAVGALRLFEFRAGNADIKASRH
jgi:hypothetical protein